MKGSLCCFVFRLLLRHLRRAGDGAPHPVHRQQLCRLLQGPDQAREGRQAEGGAGEAEEGGGGGGGGEEEGRRGRFRH